MHRTFGKKCSSQLSKMLSGIVAVCQAFQIVSIFFWLSLRYLVLYKRKFNLPNCFDVKKTSLLQCWKFYIFSCAFHTVVASEKNFINFSLKDLSNTVILSWVFCPFSNKGWQSLLKALKNELTPSRVIREKLSVRFLHMKSSRIMDPFAKTKLRKAPRFNRISSTEIHLQKKMNCKYVFFFAWSG